MSVGKTLEEKYMLHRYIALAMVLAVCPTASADDFALKMAELDVNAAEADYHLARLLIQKAQVHLEFASRNFDRMQKLAKVNGAVSEQEIAKAEAELKSAKIDVEIQKAHAEKAAVQLQRAKLTLAALRAKKNE